MTFNDNDNELYYSETFSQNYVVVHKIFCLDLDLSVTIVKVVDT